jgi:hypothetical protein
MQSTNNQPRPDSIPEKPCDLQQQTTGKKEDEKLIDSN